MNDDQMANIISIIAIGISVLSAIAVTYLSAWVTYKNDKRNKKKEYINNLIEEFYGPLISILTENSTLYKEFGPPTIIGKSAEIASANGERWNSIKVDVVIPNLKICPFSFTKILDTNRHRKQKIPKGFNASLYSIL